MTDNWRPTKWDPTRPSSKPMAPAWSPDWSRLSHDQRREQLLDLMEYVDPITPAGEASLAARERAEELRVAAAKDQERSDKFYRDAGNLQSRRRAKQRVLEERRKQDPTGYHRAWARFFEEK